MEYGEFQLHCQVVKYANSTKGENGETKQTTFVNKRCWLNVVLKSIMSIYPSKNKNVFYHLTALFLIKVMNKF